MHRRMESRTAASGHSRLGHDAAAAHRDRLRVEVKPPPVALQEP